MAQDAAGPAAAPEGISSHRKNAVPTRPTNKNDMILRASMSPPQRPSDLWLSLVSDLIRVVFLYDPAI
jgi:hypothetical protein